MIEVSELTKRFGSVVAVNNLSFTASPGRVTGFLGPNGSGKSTTMRCMVGLDRPQSGRTLFSGRPFSEITRPLTEVAVLLDAGYVHPGRTARNHLRWLAATNGLRTERVDEVLALVGLSQVAGRRVKGFSLGMRQRLGLAGVLLGDPHTIILDEPGNGLDPEGIKWVRDVLQHLAGEGRTVLVSSHLLSEMQLMAEDLVVIGQGHLIEQCSVDDFVLRHADRWVRVRSPRLSDLLAAIGRLDVHVEPIDDTAANLRGVSAEQLGEAAAANGIVLHELSIQTGSLEDAFLRATSYSVEYQAVVPAMADGPAPGQFDAPGSPGSPPPPPHSSPPSPAQPWQPPSPPSDSWGGPS